VAFGYPAPITPPFLRASWTDVDDHGTRLFVEVDRLDHRRPVDTEQIASYVGTERTDFLV
jgi:hypothetical protein